MQVPPVGEHGTPDDFVGVRAVEIEDVVVSVCRKNGEVVGQIATIRLHGIGRLEGGKEFGHEVEQHEGAPNL
jgi:hypothetical protein